MKSVWALDLLVLLDLLLLLHLVWRPPRLCWDRQRVRGPLALLAKNNTLDAQAGEEQVCVGLWAGCARHPDDFAFWEPLVQQEAGGALRVCLDRRPIYTAITLQALWVLLFKLAHLASLCGRARLSPLDFLPPFFSLAALTSVAFIFYILSTTWAAAWAHQRLPAPTDPVPIWLINRLVLAGALAEVVQWVLIHRAYHKQASPLQNVRTTSCAESLSSDKEHDE